MGKTDFHKNSCDVEYILNDQFKVSRTMTQEELADLLKTEDVFLISVNAPKTTGYKNTAYRKKK